MYADSEFDCTQQGNQTEVPLAENAGVLHRIIARCLLKVLDQGIMLLTQGFLLVSCNCSLGLVVLVSSLKAAVRVKGNERESKNGRCWWEKSGKSVGRFHRNPERIIFKAGRQ